MGASNPFSGPPGSLVSVPPWTSSFPACKLWYRMEEGTGTTIADTMGLAATTTLINPLNNWNNVRALELDGTNQSAETAAGNAALNATIAAGSTVFVEADLIQDNTGLANTGHWFELHDVLAATNGAIQVGSNVAAAGTGRVSILYRNTGWTAAGGTDTAFMNAATFTQAARHHIVAIFDLETNKATNQIRTIAFVDGAEKANTLFTTPSSAPFLTGNFNTGPTTKLVIGRRQNTNTLFFNGQIFNIRLWVITGGLPANYAAIVQDMNNNRDEFPPLLRGVA